MWQTEICNYGSFFALLTPHLPLKIQKIKFLKKWKTMLEISSFYACVPKTTITWGSVPEIQSERYFLLSWAILYPFTPLLMPKIKIWKKCKKIGYIIFLHMCAINEDHMMYGCWDIRQDIFFLFYSSSTLTTQKIKILKKWKKKRGDIIISHKYTKNHNHMLYCSSDMMHDGCNCYFSLWAVFCPFNPHP